MRTGTVISISSPSRRKNGCGSTRKVMYRSPGGSAVRARVAFARHAQTRALLRARRNPHLHGFRVRDAPVAVARRAPIAQPARALALRTRQAEAHRAGHLRHVAAAVAFRTNRVGAGRAPAAVAGGAHFLAADIQRTCVPRIACQKSMFRPYSRSVPFSRRGRVAALALPAEPLAEDIVEAGRFAPAAAALPRPPAPRPCENVGEIESAEAHVRARAGPPGPPGPPGIPFSE